MMDRAIQSPAELSVDQLEHISGGMKSDRNHVSSNVIDARGGSLVVWGVQLTFDVNGKCSGIGPAPK
jgi:hypothetical protein